ncbi:hypothetical protein [Bradyrhizobium sp. CCBAU 51753]|uniref:hypothetical protein n=1 Tax=Bradyrhizobium sp. CCBAU 51753 TaxID=1325100 RepID=UPI001FEF9200|nr:hypothetical protein [Bradyrhizobium sp. CCBAU 51753]
MGVAVLVHAIQLTHYDLRRALRSNWSKNVTIAITLLFASVLAGLATGLYLRVWALLLVSPAVALLAAIVLQSNGFGVALVVGSLVACQLAYLAGMSFAPRADSSMAEEIDGAPGGQRQQQIRGKKEQRQARP